MRHDSITMKESNVSGAGWDNVCRARSRATIVRKARLSDSVESHANAVDHSKEGDPMSSTFAPPGTCSVEVSRRTGHDENVGKK